MNYDLSAFCGHWPFRKLRRASLPEQLEEYAHLGFFGGCMSSLDAIFYNDPREADEPLLNGLKGTGWHPAICVNPLLPWWEMTTEKAHRRGVRHLRLYPGIHRYDVKMAEPVFQLAETLGMVVIVTARMEDDRLCYLLEQQPVDLSEYAEICRQYSSVPVLFSGCYAGELTALKNVPPNLWTDTSGLCHGLWPIEELIRNGVPAERMVFGSLSPLQCVHSHMQNLPKTETDAILVHNPKRFLEEMP